MKINAKTVKKTGFLPFELTISVDNEEEATKLYAFFNHTCITECWPDETDHDIRKAIEEAFCGDAVPYVGCHGELCEIIENWT